MIEAFASDQQREILLPLLSDMNVKLSFCLTESGLHYNLIAQYLDFLLFSAGSGSDAASLTTRADRDGNRNEYVLNGSKVFISGAGMSDLYLVICKEGSTELISCFMVPLGTTGLSFGQLEKKMGWSCQPTRQVVLDNVRVTEKDRLGPPGQGFKIAMAGLDGK
jgi:alkylation response protein AidB-like acyl-CoA dehydrogenase